MELLDDPDTKKKYDKCRYIVKIWEHNFTKSQKRIPSKLDIREAPTHVRQAYRKYYQLKTAVLEQSFMDVEGFEIEEANLSQIAENSTQNYADFSEETRSLHDPNKSVGVAEDIWSSHLNSQKHVEVVTGNNCQNKSTIKSVISKKLFCGSKFNKRNPRKSLSFSQKNMSSNDLDATLFLSEPTSSSVSKFTSDEAVLTSQGSLTTSVVSEPFKIVTPLHKHITQPVDTQSVMQDGYNQSSRTVTTSIFNETLKILTPLQKHVTTPVDIQSVMQDGYNQSLRTVDTRWLKRVMEDTWGGLEITSKIDSDNDEIIYDSEDEQEALRMKMSSSPVSKRRKIEPTYFINDPCLISEKLEQTIICNRDRGNKHRNISKGSEGVLHGTNERCVVSPTKTQFETPAILDSFDLNNSHFNKIKCRTISNKTRAILDETPKGTIRTRELNENKIVSDVTQTVVDKTSNIIIKNGERNETKTVVDVYIFEDNIQEVVETESHKNTKSKQRVEKSAKTTIKKLSKKVQQQNLEKDDKTKTKDSKLISPLRRSSRTTKLKVSLEEFSSGDEDPFHSDNDEKDPEFTLNENEKNSKFNVISSDNENITVVENDKNVKKRKGRNSKKKSPKQERLRRKKLQKADLIKKKAVYNLNKDYLGYELEFCVKPRIVAPRYNSVKEVLSEHKKNITQIQKDDKSLTVLKSKRQLAQEKLEHKIASGNLNDNFVTIDIKKKVFSRLRAGNRFAKFKKSQWRASKKENALCGPEMNMGGCDGGPIICFTCGQMGHFDRQCKATRGDGLLPLNAAEKEEKCPFLSLEEASQMAKESGLNIRRPRNSKESDQKVELDKLHETNECNDIDWGDDFIDERLLQETLRLEEHIKNMDVEAYLDNVKVVEPYFKLNADGSIIETPQEVLETLEKFGHNTFRPGQEKAVMRILSGKSTLVTLSTGSGKSLCYQLPAYLYSRREPCISLIISPLVSLMEDQVTGVPKFLKAACLHTNQSKIQRQKIIESLSSGELNVLLISPEAVVAGEKQTGFGSLLRKLPPIAFACIDEAHCVSQWSHNFRPSYLMICRVLRESLGVRTILGLTATATRSTCDSIIGHINITDGHQGIVSDTPLPDNLVLTVSKDANRDIALLNLLVSERFSNCRSIIVYCTRRDECERIASLLRTSLESKRIEESTNKKRKRPNLQAEPYHAGLSAARRKSIQSAFMNGALRFVVATVAFGMGINKADIRGVIHFNMPRSVESYVQEVGRAGRDGLVAYCHAFLDSQDRDWNELRRHIYANSIDRHVIRKLLQKIFIPCSCKDACPKHEVAFSIEQTVKALDIPEENISTLLCYLELHENKYIKLLSPAYTMCKVISYGGSFHLRKAAVDCPPLAMALALHKMKPGDNLNVLEFPVVDIASSMGWDSGICKHKLKNLEWTTVNNKPKRSLISVTFSNLGFRLLAPGHLDDDQLDEALDSLYRRVQTQEQTALKQLKAVHETLKTVAENTFKTCVKPGETPQNVRRLKLKVREYFKSKNPLDDFTDPETKIVSEEQLVSDIRALISIYSNNQFSGRAVARIFHGIQSPNYPAVEWGRCKFWRSHLGDDFYEICRLATREIIRMR